MQFDARLVRKETRNTCSRMDEEYPRNEKVLQVQWSEMKDDLSELASLRTLQLQRETQREILASRLTTLLEARNQQLIEKEHLTVLKSDCLERRQYLQKLRSTLNQEEESLERLRRENSSLLVSLKAGAYRIVQATQRLQDAERLLSGAEGRGQEAIVLRHLLWRRQRLTSQLASIYPITRVSNGIRRPPDSDPSSLATSFDPPTSVTGCQDTTRLAIAGFAIPPSGQSLVDALASKHEQLSIAAALGYAAHVVAQLAKYFGVHLLYPLSLAASRSTVCNPQALSPGPGNGRAISVADGNSSRREWPLYAEGQEVQAVETGVSLLNKDIEQLLSVLGAEQSGPTDLLTNLQHLLARIHSNGPPD